MDYPIIPSPATGAGRNELPAYLSNGVIGLRVRPPALIAGMTSQADISASTHPAISMR
jgi:hypothetical protein